MNEYNDNRRPEEIEGDIERTRADVSSTIDAIQSKLTPGQLMDQAFGYARGSLPADFGANLGNAVRDNPVPVALIGIGLAWLMTSGRRADGQARARRRQAEYDTHVYVRDSGADYEGAYLTDHAPDAGAEGSSEGRVHRAASKASETGRELKDKAGELGHRISDKASALTGRAREMAQGAQGAAQRTRERVSGSAGGARARMGEVSQRSQQQYYRAKDSFGRMIDEQPLMVGALGLAVGTMLGALLPGTRREDELMGRTRDDLLERAKDTAREQAEHMKESAKRVAGAAEQEVERARHEASRHPQSQGSGQTNQPQTSQSITPGGEPGKSIH